ncbi:MAG: hypothetical protein AAFP18_09125 [Bacteroidota bacterium]
MGLLLLVVNVRLYGPGDLDTSLAQLAHLRTALGEGAAEDMQRSFPEGYVFTWSLYGLASAQAAQQLPSEDPRRRALLDEARRAVEHLDTDVARAPFPAYLPPEYGAFYASWRTYALATYVRTASPARVEPTLLVRLDRQCQQLASALGRSMTPFLSSYPGLAWPADTAVGIGALGICEQVTDTTYTATIASWVAAARARQDTVWNALAHAANAQTGAPRGGVRGSSLALMSRVLVDADSAFARAQYEALREHFVTSGWGLPGVREYPHGVRGRSDIDSGPIVLGLSGPAVVVAAAAARVHGDDATARTLFALGEAFGLPVEWGGERRYLFGQLPVGEAFLVWARTSPQPAAAASWTRIIPRGWRWPIHLVSVAMLGLLLWLGRRHSD